MRRTAVLREISSALFSRTSSSSRPRREWAKTVGMARPKPLLASAVRIYLYPNKTHQRTDLRSQKQAATGLADGLAERRLMSPQPADNKAEPKTQQHGGQDGAKDGSFDDLDVIHPIFTIPRDQDHEESNLHERAESVCRLVSTRKVQRMKDPRRPKKTHVVSVKTPMTCGTFLASSWPAKPSRFAHGTMARYERMKVARWFSGMA
jgi:hypothetical protein